MNKIDYENALKEVYNLWDKQISSIHAKERFDKLLSMIEGYERLHFIIPAPTTIDIIKFRIDQENNKWVDNEETIKKQEILDILNNHGMAIKYIKYPTEEMQIAAVKNEVEALRYIDNPSLVVQLAAVRQNGFAIEYINDPSEEVQLAAIQENVYSIREIINPTEKVQLKAIEIFYNSFKYIKNPSYKVQLAAVKINYGNIKYIEDPSEELQLIAIEQNFIAIELIKNPTKAAIEKANSLVKEKLNSGKWYSWWSK